MSESNSRSYERRQRKNRRVSLPQIDDEGRKIDGPVPSRWQARDPRGAGYRYGRTAPVSRGRPDRQNWKKRVSITPSKGREGKKAHLSVHHVPNTRPQQINEFLLNERELGKVAVLLAREDGVGKAAEGKGAGKAFQFPIGENVGGRGGGDLGCEAE
jgi:hypothetical protein